MRSSGVALGSESCAVAQQDSNTEILAGQRQSTSRQPHFFRERHEVRRIALENSRLL